MIQCSIIGYELIIIGVLISYHTLAISMSMMAVRCEKAIENRNIISWVDIIDNCGWQNDIKMGFLMEYSEG